MSSQVKSLVRTLQAEGSISTAQGGLCLLSQVENRLVEKVYVNEVVQAQRKVTGNVKKHTSAVYLTMKDKTLILYIDGNNLLRCSEFVPAKEAEVEADEGGEEEEEEDDEEEAKWIECSPKGLENVRAHPESQLGGTLMPDGGIIFFQDAEGTLISLRYDADSNEWSNKSAVPATAKVGSPLWVYLTDGSLCVCYLDNDGKTHCHGRDFSTGAWKDNIVQNAQFDGPVDKFVVSQDSETAAFEAFFLTEGSVVQVRKDGTRAVLGTVKGTEFTPSTQAQSSVYIGGNNYGNITIQDTFNYNYNYNYSSNYSGYVGGYGGYGCYRPVYRCYPCW